MYSFIYIIRLFTYDQRERETEQDTERERENMKGQNQEKKNSCPASWGKKLIWTRSEAERSYKTRPTWKTQMQTLRRSSL